jgi:hypothetical protein
MFDRLHDAKTPIKILISRIANEDIGTTVAASFIEKELMRLG